MKKMHIDPGVGVSAWWVWTGERYEVRLGKAPVRLWHWFEGEPCEALAARDPGQVGA